MTEHLTEDDLLAAIPSLTRIRLSGFIQTQIILPLPEESRGARAPVFRQIDLARLRLLCELADDLDLDEVGLGVIITLIDQLHATRKELLAIARALQSEPREVRARIGAALLMAQD